MVTGSARNHLGGGGYPAAAVLFALFSALCGCGPGARFESLRGDGAAANAVEKAREAQLSGDIETARRIFEDVAAARPFDSMARLQLGILYQDILDDPYGALGEYRAFLRLAPGSEKEEMVRDRIRAARDQIARKATDGDGAASISLPGSAEQARRIAELESALAAAAAEAQASAAERDKARSEADRLQREILAKDRQLDILQNQGLTAAPRSDLSRAVESAFPAPVRQQSGPSAESGNAPVLPKSPRTYKVRRGDTLWSVAQKNYGDASRTADIRAANIDVLRGGDKLTEGMILVLPY